MDAWLRAVRWEAGKLREKIFSANFVELIQALVARRLKMSEAQLQRKVLQAWRSASVPAVFSAAGMARAMPAWTAAAGGQLCLLVGLWREG